MTNFVHYLDTLPTLFNDFHFLTEPTGVPPWLFPGQIWPKNDIFFKLVHLDSPKSMF